MERAISLQNAVCDLDARFLDKSNLAISLSQLKTLQIRTSAQILGYLVMMMTMILLNQNYSAANNVEGHSDYSDGNLKRHGFNTIARVVLATPSCSMQSYLYPRLVI